MTASRPSVEDILDQVLDVPVADRPARIVDLCGEDTALRAEVESLLDAFERSGDFLEAPLHEGSLELDPLALRGECVGSYEILERIGRGGMGDVYLARRVGEGYEQRVALKMMRSTVMAAETLHRFRNECRVLARLDHPNIARMIEGSIAADGTAFLVMEYVEGRPIDQFCDEQGLDVTERIALMREVCAALHHLHQHSTIHRDIKPANVMVRDDGQVKLIDFGIARILDLAEGAPSEFTVAGFERMTPAYASPEQLRGEDLSTATDVYSLGVLLYRVLTGTLPFRGASRRELEREITETAVVRPSDAVRSNAEHASLARVLRGDLDTIVLMALRKEPERRYSSVEQFSDDLARYLDQRPVLARGDSWSYRASKFVHRNPLAVAGAGLFLLTLVAATITGFVLFAQAEHARTEAEAERETALAVSNFLSTLLASANPSEQDSSPTLTVREVLDRASNRIGSELDHQPRLATELRLTLGRAYHNLGSPESALLQYAEARRALAADDRGRRARIDIQEAETRILLEDVALADSLLSAALSDTTVLDFESLTLAHLTRAQLLQQTGRYDAAMIAARRAHRLGSSQPSRSLLPAQSKSMVGEIAFRLGDLATAERFMRDAVEVAREGLGPRHALTATCLQNLGIVLMSSGDTAGAIAVLRDALDLIAEVYGVDHLETANTMASLGDALQASARYDEALFYYGKARTILEATLGRDSYRYATLVANEANARWRSGGDLEIAAESFLETLAVYESVLGARHPWRAVVMNNLARLRLDQSRVDEAETLAEQAEEILEEAFPDGNPLIARPLLVLADIALRDGSPADARLHLERADTLTASLPFTHADRIATAVLVARYRISVGEREQARTDLRSYLVELEGAGNTESLELQRLHQLLEELSGS